MQFTMEQKTSSIFRWFEWKNDLDLHIQTKAMRETFGQHKHYIYVCKYSIYKQ